MSEKPIRVVVIKGSVRPNNYTSMAVALVVDELRKDPQVHVQVIDPAEYNLPMPGTDWSAPGAKKVTGSRQRRDRCHSRYPGISWQLFERDEAGDRKLGFSFRPPR